MKNNKIIVFIVWIIVTFALLAGCGEDTGTDSGNINSQEIISIQGIPEYAGEPYVTLNGYTGNLMNLIKQASIRGIQ